MLPATPPRGLAVAMSPTTPPTRPLDPETKDLVRLPVSSYCNTASEIAYKGARIPTRPANFLAPPLASNFILSMPDGVFVGRALPSLSISNHLPFF